MPEISVVIPTYNEERNIRECLESVQWADEVIVVDAESQDATRAIAEEMGAKVLTFPNKLRICERQRWFGMERASHSWVLCIDADERVSGQLAMEIRAMVANPSDVEGYQILFQHFLFGRHLKHGGLGNTYLLRLFRNGRAYFEKGVEVHEQLVVRGRTARLKYPIIHHGTRDFQHYFEKFNFYTSFSAEKLYRRGVRIRWHNAFAFFVIKPAYYFFKRYFLQKGFLDGTYGLTLAFLSAFTVIVNHLKLIEIQENGHFHSSTSVDSPEKRFPYS